MAKATRLSPPLMFAFRESFREKDAKKKVDMRDASGTRVVAQRRLLRTSVSEQQLRGQVSRDLDTLMNTINLESVEDMADAPHVTSSIVNYGLPDIVNRTIDEQSNQSITGEIELAVKNFEPRLIRKTIRVRRDEEVDMATLNLRYYVSGEMSCDPVSVPVEFVADLELDSGKLNVTKR